MIAVTVSGDAAFKQSLEFHFYCSPDVITSVNKGECGGLDMRHVRGGRQLWVGLCKAPLHNDFKECFKYLKGRKCRYSDIIQMALFESSFVMT